MNYIEAHEICSNYVDIFANSTSVYQPISLLYACGASNKKNIEDAMILFLAHSVLWNELSKQELENMQMLLMQLDSFVDDEFAKQCAHKMEIVRKANASTVFKLLHKQSVNDATQFLLSNTKINLYDISRAKKALAHILEYKTTAYIPKMNRLLQEAETIDDGTYWRRFLNLVADFSDEACAFSGIETSPSDFYLFVSFELMRDWVNDENMKKHYIKYKDYILSHSDC